MTPQSFYRLEVDSHADRPSSGGSSKTDSDYV